MISRGGTTRPKTNITSNFRATGSNWSNSVGTISEPADGPYSFTLTIGGGNLKNLGYFEEIVGSPVTMRLDSIVINNNPDFTLTTNPPHVLHLNRIGGGELPNVWWETPTTQRLYENAAGDAWLANSSGDMHGNISFFTGTGLGTRVNITSITYNFTIANVPTVADTNLTVEVESGNPDITFAQTFRAINGDVLYRVNFETPVEGIVNLGSVNRIEDSNIVLNASIIIVNGIHFLLPTSRHIMETRPEDTSCPTLVS